ncbi:MAG: IS200/IS605 family transposase [Akkermansiaceae bacterium]|nr:IS200/IS605 family transposase [Akkermansiaceae bacterium]
MSSTCLSLHYHLVFSTKERYPFLDGEWRSRLHEYLGGAVRRLGAQSRICGGVADHVHLLCDLKATHRLSDFMRELKKGSSGWIKDEIGISKFAWQEGYSAFTVSATSLDSAREYVANQEEHHRKKSFREELVEFLERAGVEFDPRYLD